MIDGHGDDSYRYGKEIKVNFSSNIYNHIDNSALYRYLSDRLSLIHSYPQPVPYELEKKLAMESGINHNEVSVTNGATEAIYTLAQLFSNKISTIVMPTFSEYADACRLYHHDIKIAYSIDENMTFGDVVWICNPNNPTGEVYDKELLIDIIKKHPKTYFIFDQSYQAFTVKPLLSDKEAISFDNVVVIHSMTKQYGVPGLRLGYIVANANIVDEIVHHRMPWSVNVLAIESALFILNNKDKYKIDLASLLAEKDRVYSELKAIYGVEPWLSDTNFMLVQLRNGTASSLKEYLVEKHSLLIRDASNFHGLGSHFFRIAVQNKEENDLLINAIKEWISLY